MVEKLDVYSDIRIPFTVSAYCRHRKFNPEVVSLATAMRKDAATRKQIEELQEQLEANTQTIKDAIARVEKVMETSNAN